MKKNLTFIAMWMFVCLVCLGQERMSFGEGDSDTSMDLSIEQAVMKALENNRDLRIQTLEPVKAGTFEHIEKTAFDPELYAKYAYTREDLAEDNLKLTTDKTHEAVLGLKKTFSAGTRVEAELSHEKATDSDNADIQSTRLGLTLTQSLLKGFGPSVNLAKVRKASLETKISVYELKGFTEVLVADTENTYWNYVLAKRKIAIFEQSLALAKQQRDEIEQQIAIGLLPRTEAAATRSEVALREQDLIDAQSVAEAYRLNLLHLIDSDHLDLSINPVSHPDIDTQPVNDEGDRITLAQTSRSDLSEARLRRDQNRLDTMITRNGLLPKLDLFITIGRTGYGDRFRDTLKDNEPNFADDISIGLSLTHTLGNRSAKALNQSATASREQAELAIDNLISQVRLDVKLAVNEVERLRKQIKATHATRLFQEQTYTSEKDRFDVGSSTAFQVARAQRDLLAAQIAEVETVVSFRMALIDLYLAQGSLLDLRGVGVQ